MANPQNSGASTHARGAPVRRRSIERPQNRIVRESVRRATNPAAPSKFSNTGNGGFSGIESSYTVAIDNGTTIQNGHLFNLLIDNLSDDSAYLGVLPDE